MGNTLGHILKMHTYGESHGPGIGLVLDGFPAGIPIDEAFIQQELLRRRPGQSRITTQRKEDEAFQIHSGVFEGRSTGMPIHLHIPNKDSKSKDYSHIKDTFRPSHADYTYQAKYGLRDYRGGGRSSARETANWVAAGAFAKLLLGQLGVECRAWVESVGSLKVDKPYAELDLRQIEQNPVRCPDPAMAQRMEELIVQIRKEGDTIGGTVAAVVRNVPEGLGAPIFDKLHADLGKAMLSINAVKGFEYGSGFAGTSMKGSEHNDVFEQAAGQIRTQSNYSGGIQGGISNGMPIHFRVAFKPVATLMQDQPSVDKDGREVTVSGKGRHDPCVVPRAVPIVEALAAFVLADHILLARTVRW